MTDANLRKTLAVRVVISGEVGKVGWALAKEFTTKAWRTRRSTKLFYHGETEKTEKHGGILN
ncbi:MAG: hypothetical protein JWO44_1474 [Bacteroidetes bacterium]|nr:hypothetical protein [Bacteroidota bacterium]